MKLKVASLSRFDDKAIGNRAKLKLELITGVLRSETGWRTIAKKLGVKRSDAYDWLSSFFCSGYGNFRPDTEMKTFDPIRANGCTHHWLLETQNGPFAVGVCSSCLGTKEFPNVIEARSWTTAEMKANLVDRIEEARVRQKLFGFCDNQSCSCNG